MGGGLLVWELYVQDLCLGELLRRCHIGAVHADPGIV